MRFAQVPVSGLPHKFKLILVRLYSEEPQFQNGVLFLISFGCSRYSEQARPVNLKFDHLVGGRVHSLQLWGDASMSKVSKEPSLERAAFRSKGLKEGEDDVRVFFKDPYNVRGKDRLLCFVSEHTVCVKKTPAKLGSNIC